MNTSPLRHPVRLLYEGAEMPITQIQKWHRKHQIGKVPCRSIPFGPERNQNIVVFEPEQRLHDTVILYFHGGGYLIGTPESMDIGAFFFTERGYRFISLGYRLLSQAAFPAQIEDAYAGYEAAVAYLQKEGPLPPLVVGGNSAGGQLAAILGYNQKDRCAPVQGIISLAGVMDQDDMLPRAGHRWSPYHIVEEQGLPANPPKFLAIHGRKDTLSPYESEERFVRLLNSTAGDDIAELAPLDDWRMQHIALTAGIFTRWNPALEILFRWLD